MSDKNKDELDLEKITNSEYILVVDDNPGVLKIVTRVLKKQGYEVKSAGSVENALDIIESGLPKLIISDNNLPGKTGCYFAKTIKKMKRKGRNV